MEIAAARRLEPTARVSLYSLDARNIDPGATVVNFQDMSRDPIVFQGVTYMAWPIEVAGFKKTAKGQLPRPTLRLSNVFANEVGQLVDAFDDLIGAKLQRIVTFERYLDGHSNADPTAICDTDFYIVERLTSRSLSMLEFELVTAIDVQGVKIPNRIVSPNFCSWDYRGPECGWTGAAPWYNVADAVVNNSTLDVCSRTLNGCRLRFGRAGLSGVLRFGGFPGTELVRR